MKPWERYGAAPQQQAPNQPSGRGAGPWQRYRAPAQAAAPTSSDISFINRGIARTLGAPGDVINLGIGAIHEGFDRLGVGQRPPRTEIPIGSAAIEGGMRALDPAMAPRPGERPESAGAYISQGVGEVGGALLPFGAAARTFQGAGRVAGSALPQVASAARGFADDVMGAFAQAPVRTLGMEGAAGAGAGFGRFYGAQEFPDQPWAQALSELAGGVAASAGPVGAVGAMSRLPVTSMAVKGIKSAVFPFTEAGGMVRAQNRVGQMIEGDPRDLVGAIDAGSVGGLDAVTMTGDEGLMALRQAVLDSDAQLRGEFKQQSAAAVERLREALAEPGEGVPFATAREFFENRREVAIGLLDTRLQQAGEMAQQRIARLSPERARSEASVIVREELEKALADARKQEAALWSGIPQDTEVPTDGLVATFEQLRGSLPIAQQEDMPAVALRMLGGATQDEAAGISRRAFPGQNQPPNQLGLSAELSELQGLRSKLLEEARKARAAGDRNKARIANALADAVLADLDNFAVQSGDEVLASQYQAARDFTRRLNETFRLGAIGRTLGFAREGGSAVPAEETLARTIGRGGEGGAQAAREIGRAAGAEDLGVDPARAAGVRLGAEDYLRSQFSDAAVRNGQLDPNAGQRFLTANAEVLNQFPALRQQIAEAIQAQRLSNETVAAQQGRRAGLLANRPVGDPTEDAISRLLNAPITAEIDALVKSRNPAEAARALRTAAQADQTGEAVRGLKSGLVDYVGVNANALTNPRFRAAAEEIFTPAEMQRFDQITEELGKVQAALASRVSAGQVIDDVPNRIIDFIGRTIGARYGAQAGAGTSGASLVTAQFFSQRVRAALGRLTNDQASSLITRAVTEDPELLKALLLRLDTPSNQRLVNRRLEAWLAGAALEEPTDTNPDDLGRLTRALGGAAPVAGGRLSQALAGEMPGILPALRQSARGAGQGRLTQLLAR